MNRKINAVEIGILNYFIIRAFFIGITFNYLITVSKQDGWFLLILSLFFIIIYILFLNKFINYNLNDNFSQKIKSLFNNYFGKFILILIYLLLFILIVFNFINLNNFIHSQFLDKTPIIIIATIFMSSIYYLLSKGIHTITRTSTVLFFIGFSLFLLSLLGLLNLTDLSKLLPVFQIKGSAYFNCISSILAYNIFPMFLITTLPKSSIESINAKKVLIISSILAILTLIIVYVVTLEIFGPNLSSLYEYPEFLVLRNISILGMDTKIDSILAIQWLFDMFIFITFSIYFIQSNIECTININKNIINLIICILVFITTIGASIYDVFFNDVLIKYAHFCINLIFIPIFIVIYIKLKIRNNS